MNWLDLALVLFIVILLVIGIKKGFMTSVISNFTLSINALLSFFLAKPISALYNKCGLGTAIANSYHEKFMNLSSDFGKNLLDVPKKELGKFVSNTLDKGNFSNLTEWLYEWFLNKRTLYDELHSSNHTSRTMADILSETYSSFYVSIIAFVTTFVLLFLIVFLLKILVVKLRTIGYVKAVDSTLGALYGLFRVFICLIIVCLVIKLISPFSFMTSVTNYINDSFFGNIIYGTINSFIDNYLNFNDIVKTIF